MDGETEQWFGPGETARRLGVTTKALRVYERERLVIPRRTESGWRLYGPAHIARLHQIIVLRDLGLSLDSIGKLVASQSQLRDILHMQRESLELQREKIGRALSLIQTAQSHIDEGTDLSLDDLITLTKETVVQQSTEHQKFVAKLEAQIAERDPTGEASRAFEKMKEDSQTNIGDAQRAELKGMMAEAVRLKEAGDVDSEAAKDFVRRFQRLVAGVRRPTQAELMSDAFAKTVAEAQSNSESLAFDPALLSFIVQIKRGMRERGELD